MEIPMDSEQDRTTTIHPDRMRRFSYGLNLLLAATCIALVVQNRQLKGEMDGSSASILQPGKKMGEFHYRHLDGRDGEFTFSESGGKYFFFIFTTNCPYCQGSLAEVQALVDQISGDGEMSIWGISLDNADQTAQYFVRNSLRFRVVTVREDFASQYGASSVPMFILLSSEGVVQRVWRGEMSSDRRSEIASLLNGPTLEGGDTHK
jgi:peroxiredoxin